MPHTGFRLLQSPNNFQGVKLGWWIIHKWENCPRYQVKLLYRVLLSPFSLWWLTSLCNVLYTPTINLFYFISLMAGSGIQLASQPFCQNFTDMALLGLLFNRWAKKPQVYTRVATSMSSPRACSHESRTRNAKHVLAHSFQGFVEQHGMESWPCMECWCVCNAFTLFSCGFFSFSKRRKSVRISVIYSFCRA